MDNRSTVVNDVCMCSVLYRKDYKKDIQPAISLAPTISKSSFSGTRSNLGQLQKNWPVKQKLKLWGNARGRYSSVNVCGCVRAVGLHARLGGPLA